VPQKQEVGTKKTVWPGTRVVNRKMPITGGGEEGGVGKNTCELGGKSHSKKGNYCIKTSRAAEVSIGLLRQVLSHSKGVQGGRGVGGKKEKKEEKNV